MLPRAHFFLRERPSSAPPATSARPAEACAALCFVQRARCAALMRFLPSGDSLRRRRFPGAAAGLRRLLPVVPSGTA
jgi:hypothetical protein